MENGRAAVEQSGTGAEQDRAAVEQRVAGEEQSSSGVEQKQKEQQSRVEIDVREQQQWSKC